MLIISFDNVDECMSYLYDMDIEETDGITYIYNPKKKDSYLVGNHNNEFKMVKLNNIVYQ